MNIDYATFEENVIDGTFCVELEQELTVGFRALRMSGEPLPLATYYASQIAVIVSRGAPEPLNADLAFHVYQEILLACEHARATVLGEDMKPS